MIGGPHGIIQGLLARGFGIDLDSKLKHAFDYLKHVIMQYKVQLIVMLGLTAAVPVVTLGAFGLHVLFNWK
eukprot:Pgem_evm1s19379